MSSKPQYMDNVSLTRHDGQGTKSDASPLHPSGKSTVFTKWIGKVEVKPRDQQRINLGHFTDDHPAKGFSLDLNSNVPDAITTMITPLNEKGGYTLVLHTANYSNKTIGVDIWGME